MSLFNNLRNLFNRKKHARGDYWEEEPRQVSKRRWWEFWKKREEVEEPVEEFEEVPKEDREQEEAEEKERDRSKREEEREKSRKTFNERYGTRWTEEEYNRFWDLFGDPVYNQTFGSSVLIYAAEYSSENNIPFDEFIKIVNDVVKDAQGAGWNQMQAVDELHTRLNTHITSTNDFEGWVDDLI